MSMDRVDRHIRMMTEFLKEEVEEHIVDLQRELDDAIARGNDLTRRYLEKRLAENRATLQRCEAELRAA